MNEYIERKEALRRFTFEHGNYIPEVDVDNFPNTVSIKDIRRIIREIPAADVAPVRHGKWVKTNNGVCYWHECSLCHERQYKSEWFSNYCPNCGAKMDGKE